MDDTPGSNKEFVRIIEDEVEVLVGTKLFETYPYFVPDDSWSIECIYVRTKQQEEKREKEIEIPLEWNDLSRLSIRIELRARNGSRTTCDFRICRMSRWISIRLLARYHRWFR